MREAGIWTKVTRVKDGGGHVYIPKEILETALSDGKLDPTNRQLEVSFNVMRDCSKGRGSIHVRVRAIKGVKDDGKKG